MMRCCFDKRVWVGLGLLAAVLLVADPKAGWAALPVLAGLACPVSMLVMMPGMRQGAGPAAAAPRRQAAAGRPAGDDRSAQIARLRREIRRLRANAGDISLAAAEAVPVARGVTGPADPAGRGSSATGG